MEGLERRRRVVTRCIRGTARCGKYLLLVLVLYVASFGPVAAWYQIARSPALGDAIVIAYTPLALSAMVLQCDTLLRDYADLCERAITRIGGTDDPIPVYPDYASEPSVWEQLFGLPELETPYRTHGGVI
jgi:hypothetical protein